MADVNFTINAEVIVTHDGKDGAPRPVVVFECDPLLNKECNKRSCFINGGPCRQVRNVAYAKRHLLYGEKETTEKQGKKNGKAIKR